MPTVTVRRPLHRCPSSHGSTPPVLPTLRWWCAHRCAVSWPLACPAVVSAAEPEPLMLACRTDIYGARDAGCYAWLWGVDVHSFKQVAKLVLHGGEVSSDDED